MCSSDLTEITISGGSGGTTDGVVSGATLTGSTILTLGRTEGLDNVIVDLSVLSGSTITANNGLTKIGDNIVLGGTLTGETQITGSTNSGIIFESGGTPTLFSTPTGTSHLVSTPSIGFNADSVAQVRGYGLTLDIILKSNQIQDSPISYLVILLVVTSLVFMGVMVHKIYTVL